MTLLLLMKQTLNTKLMKANFALSFLYIFQVTFAHDPRLNNRVYKNNNLTGYDGIFSTILFHEL